MVRGSLSSYHMKTQIDTGRLAALLGSAAFAFLLVGSAQAATIDLTTADTSGSVNGAFFSTNNEQPTGSGVIDPFLRLQGTGVETGLNSDEGNADVLGDTKTGMWTHDIMLSELCTTMLSGTEYYQFLLDINQTNANPLLSLDELQFYTSPNSITDGEQDSLDAIMDAGGTLRYDLDAGADSTVLLNYALNPGSGAGDLWIYIPTSAFTGASMDDYLYLYAQFGGYGDAYQANDGFEEFAALCDTAVVPDGGATVLLLGLGLLLFPALRRQLIG